MERVGCGGPKEKRKKNGVFRVRVFLLFGVGRVGRSWIGLPGRGVGLLAWAGVLGLGMGLD